MNITYIQFYYLSSPELQEDDKVSDTNAQHACQGAPANGEISIATQGSNILNFFNQNLQTFLFHDIVFY